MFTASGQLQSLIKEKKGNWTYSDYDLLPPELPCQIINGELTMSPAPYLKHQDISREIEILILGFISRHPQYKDCKVYDAPVDVVFDEGNVFQPDLVFISSKNKKIITEKNIQGAPDLIVEILSPSTIKSDRGDKKEKYAQYKVPEYWIVDPENKAVEIYELVKGNYKIYSFAAQKGVVQSKVLKGFKMKIENVFSNI
ncbi:MAG: Uma2 family endonuclease [Bacteroidetes bacterium]|nr:Uma2 family endonuclease [Bacteroidota bacterium]